MNRLTESDLDDFKLIAETLVSTITPLIVKAMAVSRAGAVHMLGDKLVAEPNTDHRRALWVSVYAQCADCQYPAEHYADIALKLFDERFSK